MSELNFHHCASPMMAINVSSFGMCMLSMAAMYAAPALKWLYEPYDKNAIRWKNFRKRLAEALLENREKILAIDWIKTYRERFPDEWQEIEDIVLKLKQSSVVVKEVDHGTINPA